MPGELFYWVFNMSITAALCGLPILFLRAIKRIPRRVFLWLWLIPFVRMCVLGGMSSKFSLLSVIARFTSRSVTIGEPADHPIWTMTNHVMGAESYFPLIYRLHPLETLFDVSSCVWIIVGISLILGTCVMYVRTMKDIRSLEHSNDQPLISDLTRSPAVYGIRKPIIVLPHAISSHDIPYILLHEKMHIKRGDNLIRIAALLIVCIHWFNPFAWLFLKMLYEDIEHACDEDVLRICGETEKKAYARVLLSTIEQTNVFSVSFGGASIRRRIENILSYRRLSAMSSLVFSALILSIAYMLLTNPL